MTPEQKIPGEDPTIYRSWNTLFYVLGAVAFFFFLSMITLYWHASIVKDGLSYPYAPKNKFPGLRFHEGVMTFLILMWALSLAMMIILPPFALFIKRKVSWKALLFCIASHSIVFLYCKYSTFLDWIIE